MDLTPRTIASPSTDGADPSAAGADTVGFAPHRPASAARRIRTLVLVAVVLSALGFVAFRGLGNATLFFYNVDEAVAKQTQLGDDRFRLQGSVDGDLDRTDGEASFTVVYNDVTAPVRHQGEIPKMFAPGIPVVLEGRWVDGVFASDRMLVKHSEVYVAENPERVTSYDETPTGATVPTASIEP